MNYSASNAQQSGQYGQYSQPSQYSHYGQSSKYGQPSHPQPSQAPPGPPGKELYILIFSILYSSFVFFCVKKGLSGANSIALNPHSKFKSAPPMSIQINKPPAFNSSNILKDKILSATPSPTTSTHSQEPLSAANWPPSLKYVSAYQFKYI
jgi:hypothetical protein